MSKEEKGEGREGRREGNGGKEEEGGGEKRNTVKKDGRVEEYGIDTNEIIHGVCCRYLKALYKQSQK